MAGNPSPGTKAQVKVYLKLDFAKPATNTFADWFGAGKVFTAAELTDWVVNVPEIGGEPDPINYTVAGDAYKRQAHGAVTPPTYQFTTEAKAVAGITALLGGQGKSIAFAEVLTDNPSDPLANNANTTAHIITGTLQVPTFSPGESDVNQYRFIIAADRQDPIFADKA